VASNEAIAEAPIDDPDEVVFMGNSAPDPGPSRARSNTITGETPAPRGTKRKVIEEYFEEEGQPRRLVKRQIVTIHDLTED
jgi:hypothetical protein